MTHRVVVCSTCEGKDGKGFAETLRAAFAKAGLPFEVQDFDCMSNCGKPLSVAFKSPDKATYLFGEIDPDTDLDDTVAFARMYLASDDGWIEDARGAGRLRFCLIGRVPA